MTKIIFCGCKGGLGAEFQDKKYGKGKRVFNTLENKGNQPQEYRCTVCSAVRE